MTAYPINPAWFAGQVPAGSLPPVERWQPALCGDSQMRIGRDGTWFHQGAPIGRPELVRLFAGLLRKDDEGFMLVTPAEKLSIAVEDAPFLAVALAEHDGVLTFSTNIGDRVALSAGCGWRLKEDGRGAQIPYVTVRGGLEARIARPLYYQLAEQAVTRDGQWGLVSGGGFFALGPQA